MGLQRPTRLGRAVAAATVLTSVAGCGKPEFQYPHDATEGVYFKLPSSWTVFDQTEEYYTGRLDAGATAQPIRLWLFDAHDDADVANTELLDGDQPVGRAQIIEVSPSISEVISISSVRSLGFEFDPVSPPTGLDETWEVAVDTPLRTADGISGAVAVFNHRQTAADDWLSQAREVFVDPTRQRVYLLDLYCTAACFDAHRDQIFEVLDSWRIDL